MTEVEIKVKLVNEYLPFEADIVGNDILVAIASGSEVKMPKQGESFDITPVFELLATLTTIISNLIVIYITLKSEKKQAPTTIELKQSSVSLIFPDTLADRREELISDVIEAMEQYEDN